jgi:ABC-type phosphate/phosphonate transport system ATPase subunit
VTETVLQFDQVTKVYQGRQIALADVSLTVPRGDGRPTRDEQLGKSTLLRLAMGLISASAATSRSSAGRCDPA